MGETSPAVRPRVGFVLERTLGHATHAQNLQAAIAPSTTIEPVFSTVDYESAAVSARFPVVRNWTVRAGLQARRSIRRMTREAPLDALFVHTQVPAMLIPDLLRRIPSVVSLDATPRQYDDLGEHYDHRTASRPVERLKEAVHQLCFRRAVNLVTWSEWTKADLVEHYRVPAEKVVVIPPGVDLSQWLPSANPPVQQGQAATRVLFVGGDFARKGGFVLLEAVRYLQARDVKVEVDIVTRDEITPEPSVRVHHGLIANSPALVDLYRRADVFCLPTRADCLGIAFAEAGALGVPAVATDVGGVGEVVRDGESGLLVPVDDAVGLADAIDRLAADPGLRRRLGEGARRVVLERYDASANAAQLVELLRQAAIDRSRPNRSRR